MSKTEQASPLPPETVKPGDPRTDPPSHAELHLQLLEQYAPPSLVLNGDYDIVHMSPHVGRYLHVAAGEPSPNLLSLIRDELRTLVRTALLQAMEGHRGVDLRGLRVRTDEGEESIDIHIRPVLGPGNPARGYILVVFEPASAEPIARPAASRELDEIGRARFELEARVEERTTKLQQGNRSLRREAHDRDLAEHARAALARQLANAQEAERRRIARELHDQFGQQVSALVLKLAMLRDSPALAPKAREEIERLEAIARRLDADLDFLVWQLRPTALDDLGLQKALHDYVDSWSRHFEVPVTMDLSILADTSVEHDVETALYRAAQEALNNVAKHAHATRVRVALAREAGDVVLSIEDNGQGFAPKKAKAGSGGLGLVGMGERLSVVGGSLDIESQPGKGTIVRVRAPVQEP